jgi:predicted amidohydrolase
MTDLHLDEFITLGSDSGRGNLLGVQPYLSAEDYATGEAFYSKIEVYLQAARQQGWLGANTVVVYPETIGTWLVAAGEGVAIFRAQTMNAAMRPLILRHALPFARELLSAREKNRTVAGLFRMKAARSAELYQAAFSRLARQYEVTVVAGSIYLPSPQVKDGRLLGRRGPLYNTSAVFRPDGLAYEALARKCFPTAYELTFASAAPLAGLPVFETPAGRLGVLVCADSWYPQAYERLRAAGAELVAVPSLAVDPGIWNKPWGGYNPPNYPPDVDRADAGRLTEGQAWLKYALAGRLASSGARCGVNVFLHGELWDLGTDNGNSVAVRGVEVVEARKNAAALLNVWV